MTKIFISQPMRGQSEDYILAERKEIMDVARKVYGEVEELPTYFTDHGTRTPLECLAKSIEFLAQADVAIFAKGWDTARGCRIENECCYWYGIDKAYYSDLKDQVKDVEACDEEAVCGDCTPA